MTFLNAVERIIEFEGGYVDHPSDPGGATKYGITRKSLADWRKVSPWQNLPKTEVQSLRKTEARQIYFNRYWQVVQGSKLPAGLAFALFDFAVNSGPARAIKTVQKIVNAPVDGRMGPITRAAIIATIGIHSQLWLIEKFCAARLRFLQGLSTYKVFGRGWKNRVEKTQEISNELARAELKLIPKETEKMTFLAGYKTYITAALMLIIGVLQSIGVDLPSFDNATAGHLIMEAFAIIFLRKGIKEQLGA